ncbi:MAG: DUF3857 domain-containing protein [Deltaproteobacteria bacterium]|nr:DUF3857 domain-containing protein [Deltaproteobacteria bacterium]MCL5791621.1 DUF3857 domain-containing protein [Deltaproteobacteria bacterium]
MKRILLTLISLTLLPAMAFAKNEHHEAGAIILKDIENTKLYSNFTYTTLSTTQIKILNKRGVTDYCEVVIPYSTMYQKIDIVNAQTLTADGNVLMPGKKAINNVTPPFIFSAPIYSDVKYRTITMPGCTAGATISYTVLITTIKPYMKNNFFDRNSFQTSDPIELSEYEISMPKDMKFYFKQYRFDTTPMILEKGNRIIYKWELKDVPQIITEANMPPMSDFSKRIAISTVGSWDELAKWYWGLAGTQYVSDKSLENKVKELTKGLNSRDEKIKAIYDYVALNIRYVGIEFGIEGYKPHKATEVFKNKYGDCKDHATLLLTMLKLAGITAYPVLVDTTGIAKMDPSLPSPGQFDHEIVVIPEGNKYWFLDSTSDVTSYKDLPPMDQRREVVIIYPDKAQLVTIPIFPPGTNNIINRKIVKINNDGSINIDMKLIAKGVYSMEYKYILRGMKPEQRRTFVESLATGVCPAANVTDYSISDLYNLNIPVTIGVNFACRDFVIKAGDLLIVKVPTPSMQNLSDITAKNKRTYPLFIGYNLEKNSTVSLNIPSGYRIRYMPENMYYKDKFGDYKIRYKRLEKHLSYSENLISTAYSVDPQDYKELKQLFDKIVISNKNQVIVFEKLNFKRHVVKRHKATH